MTFFESMRDAMKRLAVFEELDVDAAALPSAVVSLSDRSVRDALTEVVTLSRQVDTLTSVLAGVAAARSGREHGHGGLVQETGHRTAVEFIRDVAGVTRGEAIRTVKVGESLLQGAARTPDSETPDEQVPAERPWHHPVDDALLAGAITTVQHDAIMRGLGHPAPEAGLEDSEAAVAWQAAAMQLLDEAPTCTVEDLAARARALRDLVDPQGAQTRHAEAFDRRSHRFWTDRDGVRHGRVVYDPEMGAWMEQLLSTALSPRRGGPRFVADDETRGADDLATDPRSNDQLAYDLLVDLLRAGAAAQHHDVYGANQAGVRLVTMKDAVTGEEARRDAFGRLIATACTDDGHLVIPGPVLEHALCVTGTVDLTTDTAGNPLDVGRELRLYTRKQRIALAARDGGCVWPGCDRPPQLCEAHHIDAWAEGGATDCDRGVLLCRYHHLSLHNNAWRITRTGTEPFVPHPPPHLGSEPIVLRSTSPLRWLWDPPPDRRSWRIAA